MTNGFFIRRWVDRHCHVADSDLQVIRKVWKSIADIGKTQEYREHRRETYRRCLEHHHDNQNFVIKFRL